ncbi:MAG: hypothetical protein PVH29_03740 [Candidatus Zixiibacteriota bacterium]|jgi:hypothetical protein
MSGDIKEELKRLGVDVRPGSEMPSDVREMIEAYAPGLPRAGQVGVELTRLARDQVYTYEDRHLKLLIPVPPLDIFEAFISELKKLGPGVKDEGEYITILARAFWLLHQKPRERRIPWRQRSRVPKVDEAAARRLLVRAIPNAGVIAESLRDALISFAAFVLGKKKDLVGPRDTAA